MFSLVAYAVQKEDVISKQWLLLITISFPCFIKKSDESDTHIAPKLCHKPHNAGWLEISKPIALHGAFWTNLTKGYKQSHLATPPWLASLFTKLHLVTAKGWSLLYLPNTIWLETPRKQHIFACSTVTLCKKIKVSVFIP